MSEPLRIRRLGKDDADSLAEFYRAVGWDADATQERVREGRRTPEAENALCTGADSPTIGVFVGSRLTGFVTTIPIEFWNGTSYTAGHWLKGYTVLEEFRNGPIAYLLLKEMMKHVEVVASMPVPLAARQLSSAVGMRDLGAVHDYITPLRPARVLRKLETNRFGHLQKLPLAISLAVKLAKLWPFDYALGAVISWSLAALTLPSIVSARQIAALLQHELPSEAALDDLWARARSAKIQSATRSGRYLWRRYEQGGRGRYLFASAWCDEKLVGLAVLAHPQRRDDSRIAGLGIGSVVDLVLDPDHPAALAAVLGVARNWARSAQYDLLLLTASYGALQGRLLRAGFLRIPGNIHLMLRDPGGRYGFSTNLDTWMVTRGDAWGDHV